ncbi:FxsA family protein [Devosia faecipullorum]|uniref:FxsA family protein n=1 Tax=Devosia faecipullorum TaxID=2755039 RepID=UPI00187BC063|nr:FxsA family protein [Devosia faecipullorum]MBE7732624.1 FxsA family protein [Devosia faecipullorum]
MARFFAFGFLALPLLEIALFIVVGRAIGLLPTLALVILSALAGGLVLRRQGLDVVARLRSNVSAGTIPGRAVFDTMLIGLAGLLLFLPGFFSDVLGLGLLLPPLRDWMFSALAGRVRVVETTASYRRYGNPHTGGGEAPLIIDASNDDWRDERK